MLLDHALPVVLIIKLSGAWYHPGLLPNDTAPGITLLNALFLASCLYGTMRLLLTHAIEAIFAEPAYLALLAFAAFGITLSVSSPNSLGMVRTATLFFGSCVFLRCRFSPYYLLRLFVAVMGAVMLLSLVAALATPIGIMHGFDVGRWRGIFNHKNSLGKAAAITLIVGGGLFAANILRTYWLVPVVVVTFVCLVMSGSATALATAAVGSLVLATALLIVRMRVIRQQGLWLLLALIALLAIGGYASTGLIAAALGRDLTFTGRTEIWQQFLYFADQRPWTGWGWATISTTDHMLPIIRQTLGLPYIQTPHSGYLSLLVELGYPGLLAFAAWLAHTIFMTCRQAILERNRAAMIRLAVACALVVHSLFESTSGALPSLWLLLLFAVGPRVTIRWH